MSITSQRSAVHADPASRAAGRAPVVALPVPAPRETARARLLGLLTEIRAVADQVDTPDPLPSTVLDEEEFAVQDLVLAGESADLRARAAHLLATAEAGVVDAERADAVLCAFRSYEPFLGERDRALNATAARSLIAATASVHACSAA